MTATPPEAEATPLPLRRVLIVDDHALVRDGLRAHILSLEPDVDTLEADDFDHALAAIRDLDVLDLALVDLDVPGEPWRDGITHLLERFPDLRVVVVSGSQTIDDIRDALDLGAVGFIPKSTTGRVFTGALNLILGGGVYVPPMVMQALMQPADDPEEGSESSAAEAVPAAAVDAYHLTPRQRELLPMLAEGLSNKEIARRMGIGEGTVKLHVSAVIRALEAKNRTHAANIAAGILAGEA